MASLLQKVHVYNPHMPYCSLQNVFAIFFANKTLINN